MGAPGFRLTHAPTSVSVGPLQPQGPRTRSRTVVVVISKATTTGLAIAVTVIWAANVIAGIVMDSYEADQAVNGIFMAIVGGLIAASRGGSKGGDEPK
jgi:hypothetical protein